MVAAVRRSGRNNNKTTHYREESDSEDASDHEIIDSDIEFTETRKRSKRDGNNAKKKKRGSKKLTKKEIEEIEANLPPNHLFQMLSSNEVDTKELALEWADSYTEDEENGSNDSMLTLINLLLRSCGSIHLFQSHDLLNIEIAQKSVDELTIAFSKQQNHKYPFKVLSHYRKNVLDFFVELINVAHEKGLLYKYNNEDEESSLSSPLMVQVLTWIGSLGSSQIRPLRYTSTVILLIIQNELCAIIKNIISSLEKFQRQLARTSKSASKKSKVDTLNNTIQTYHSYKDTILEYFDEIGSITLEHRYRDIDATIRQECVKNLSQAMIIYPDYFFQASFLRYFGWLLSDPSHQVRVEVSRVLLKLYKNANNNSNMGIGFRQFTERYKEQIIKMASIDNDLNVRFNSTSICCELLKIGFLDENDKFQIINIFFQLLDERNHISIVHEKVEMELARFISIVNENSVSNEIEKYSIFFENYESNQFGYEEGKLNLENCFKIKNLIALLRSACNHFFESVDKFDINLKQALSYIFRCLYQIPVYSDMWETLIRFLLFDSSSINFTPKDPELNNDDVELEEIKQALDLSGESDKLYILSFLDGALTSIFNSQLKKKSDELSAISIKLSHYLPSLQNLSIKSDDHFYFCISIFDTLINCEDENSNIYTVFKNMNQVEVFNEIVHNFLKFYTTYESQSLDTDDLIEKYDSLFGKLLENYDNAATNLGISIMNPDIRMQVQNLIHELIAETKEVIYSNKSSDNYINILKNLYLPILKLKVVANNLNLNESLANNDDSIIHLIFNKVIKLVDIDDQFKHNSESGSTIIKNITLIAQTCKSILDLNLVTVSWKLEELIRMADNNDTNMQSQNDIVSIFKNATSLMECFTKLLDSINKISVDMNYFESFDQTIRLELIQKLYDFSTVITTKLIDLTTSVKIFYVKYNTNNNFKNFDEFFNSGNVLANFITRITPIKFQNEILDIFLFKEAKVGQLLSVKLDRSAGENMNYHDIFTSTTCRSDNEKEFSSSNENISDHEQDVPINISENLWLAQKDLCVFTVKILALVDISMVNTFVLDRVKLNSNKIGGIFCKIIEQNQSHIKANSIVQGD